MNLPSLRFLLLLLLLFAVAVVVVVVVVVFVAVVNRRVEVCSISPRPLHRKRNT